MTWSDFVKRGLLQPQKFNERALADLWAVVERDLKDSKLEQLSNDRRFATAYSAALNVARISVAMAGYRILAKAGHHKTTFEAASVALGDGGASICDYFDICRRKRNKIDYDIAEIIADHEVDEILRKVEEFVAVVKALKVG